MLLLKPLPETKIFVSHINAILKTWSKDTLSKSQCFFIAIVISAMTISGQLCCAWIARASLNRIGTCALSWMLHHSKIRREEVLNAATFYLMQLYEVFEVNLVVDDTSTSMQGHQKNIWGI